jgi:large subunit ribosomal protein L21
LVAAGLPPQTPQNDWKKPVRKKSGVGIEHEDRKMFAVIKTGGKQYRVAAEDVLQVEKINGEPGEIVQFGEVLAVGGDAVTLGLPTVAGASVAAEVLEQGRGPKVIAFKKRRRKNSRRKRGHRQEFTLVRITEILTDGAKPTKTARPKPVAKPKPAETAAEDADTAGEAEAAPKASAKAKKPARAAARKPARGKPAAKGKSKK